MNVRTGPTRPVWPNLFPRLAVVPLAKPRFIVWTMRLALQELLRKEILLKSGAYWNRAPSILQEIQSTRHRFCRLLVKATQGLYSYCWNMAPQYWSWTGINERRCIGYSAWICKSNFLLHLYETPVYCRDPSTNTHQGRCQLGRSWREETAYDLRKSLITRARDGAELRGWKLGFDGSFNLRIINMTSQFPFKKSKILHYTLHVLDNASLIRILD